MARLEVPIQHMLGRTWGALSEEPVSLRCSSVQMLSAHTLMLARYCAVACSIAARLRATTYCLIVLDLSLAGIHV